MKITKSEITSALDYLWFALYAFAGLGIEMLLLGVIEPMIFNGIKMADYSTVQSITHWVLTSICWGAIGFILVFLSKRKLGFQVMANKKITTSGVLLSLIIIIACIALNFYDWGTLKIVGEFQNHGILLFLFQYLYYFFEVVLVFLIVSFGQKFIETVLKKKSRIPWGGILLTITWGAVHYITKGNVVDALGTMAFSIAYGLIYLLLERNAKWSYLAMAAAFMI